MSNNHYAGRLIGKDENGKYAENPWSIDHEDDHNASWVGLSTTAGRIVALVVNDDSRRPLLSHEAELDANARRLVACWNACDGVSTAAVELIIKQQEGMSGLLSQLEIVKSERGELLAALERLDREIREAWDARELPASCISAEACQMATKAIAAAKGGAA